MYPYSFEAPLERFGVGRTKKLWYNVLFLPKYIQRELPFDQYPRLRVEGEIAEVPIENAFIPTGDGRYYVIVAPAIIKNTGLKRDDVVEMRFRIADQGYVEVPSALQDALAWHKALQKLWDDYTPGKKRMIAHFVRSAKTATTQAKRISEAMDVIENFDGDLRKWQSARKTKQE